MKTIEIIVSSNGETKIKTQGFAGSECLKATRFLESTLGKTIAEQHTAEFFQGVEQMSDVIPIGNR